MFTGQLVPTDSLYSSPEGQVFQIILQLVEFTGEYNETQMFATSWQQSLTFLGMKIIVRMKNVCVCVQCTKRHFGRLFLAVKLL